MSVYFFRPVQPGICVACGKPYPKLTAYVHLTAEGVKHPACDTDAPVTVNMVKPAQSTPPIDAVVEDTVWDDDVLPLPAPPPKKPPKPKPKRPASKKKPPAAKKPVKKEVQMRVLDTTPRPETEGSRVCRSCWTVHAPGSGCGK